MTEQEKREATRRKLQADTEAFLAAGGKITEIPAGISGEMSKYSKAWTPEMEESAKRGAKMNAKNWKQKEAEA